MEGTPLAVTWKIMSFDEDTTDVSGWFEGEFWTHHPSVLESFCPCEPTWAVGAEVFQNRRFIQRGEWCCHNLSGRSVWAPQSKERCFSFVLSYFLLVCSVPTLDIEVKNLLTWFTFHRKSEPCRSQGCSHSYCGVVLLRADSESDENRNVKIKTCGGWERKSELALQLCLLLQCSYNRFQSNICDTQNCSKSVLYEIFVPLYWAD